MKNRRVIAASFFVSLMTVTGLSAAAQSGMPMDRQAQSMPAYGMQGNMPGQMQGMMAGPMVDQMPGMMMGGRQAMNGMGGMMAGCPMMGAMTGVLTPQQHMKMHAEMMQAMGEIMEKYAAQAEKGPN